MLNMNSKYVGVILGTIFQLVNRGLVKYSYYYFRFFIYSLKLTHIRIQRNLFTVKYYVSF